MLMLESLDGDAKAYVTLLTELERVLRGFFRRRLDAALADRVDDLVQETLLAVHQRRQTYDRARPFTAWMHAVARYKLIDMLRRERRLKQVPIDDYADLLGNETEAADSAMTNADLNAMLKALPARTETLVRQVKLEGRPVAEVAAQNAMSASAVKVAVHRGLRLLIARMGGRP